MRGSFGAGLGALRILGVHDTHYILALREDKLLHYRRFLGFERTKEICDFGALTCIGVSSKKSGEGFPGFSVCLVRKTGEIIPVCDDVSGVEEANSLCCILASMLKLPAHENPGEMILVVKEDAEMGVEIEFKEPPPSYTP